MTRIEVCLCISPFLYLIVLRLAEWFVAFVSCTAFVPSNGCCNLHHGLFLRMRYVAAYLLAALGGNDSPQAKDIKKILESVGIEADDTRMEKVCWISHKFNPIYKLN